MLTRNVCRKCERYFPNITGGSCPICNGMLRDLNLSPWESYACDNRSGASTNAATCASTKQTPFPPGYSPVQPHQTGIKPMPKTKTTVSPFDKRKTEIKPASSPKETVIIQNKAKGKKVDNQNINKKADEQLFHHTTITGEIIEASERTDNRLIISQLYQYFFYGQPFGRNANHFIIRDESNRTHFVNAYGEISGGGAHPAVHTLVEVTGRYNSHHTLLIRRMRVKNGPDIRFKTPADVVHDILRSLRIPIILLILIAIAFFVSNNITSISNILITILFAFGLTYVVLSLFTKAIFSDKFEKGRRLLCFVASAILTILFFIYSLMGV